MSGFSLYNVILLPALNVFGEIGLEDMQASFIEGILLIVLTFLSCPHLNIVSIMLKICAMTCDVTCMNKVQGQNRLISRLHLGHCATGEGTCEEDIETLLATNTVASTHYYFLQILMFLYLLFVNVLLLNLLIAIFSNT